jgi:hypothetical protein
MKGLIACDAFPKSTESTQTAQLPIGFLIEAGQGKREVEKLPSGLENELVSKSLAHQVQ